MSTSVKVASRESADSAEAEVTLLVAEDNAINQKVIAQQLKLLGYAADITADGVEALAAYQDGGYALLLTDCNMPNMDGYELARQVRQIEQTAGADQHLPIVALTANAHVGEEARCLDAGMDALLVKPTNIHKLDETLARMLSDAAATTTTDLANTGVTTRELLLIDRAALRELLGGEAPLVALALLQFRNAAEQLDSRLERALVDGRDASAEVEWLLGAARAICAEPLASLCEAYRGGDDPAKALKNLRALLTTTIRQIRPC